MDKPEQEKDQSPDGDESGQLPDEAMKDVSGGFFFLDYAYNRDTGPDPNVHTPQPQRHR